MKKLKYLFLSLALVLVLGFVTETFAAPNYVKTKEQLGAFFGINQANFKPAGFIDQIITALDQNKVAMQQGLVVTPKPTVTLLSTQAINDSYGPESTEGDTAMFRITFKVRADAEDIYMATNSARINGSVPWDKVLAYAIQSSGVDINDGIATSLLYSNATTDGGGYYKIARGTEAIFTIEVAYKPDADGTFRLRFDSIAYKNAAGVSYRAPLSPSVFKTNYLTSRALRGPVVSLVSTNATLTANEGANDDVGTFNIRFKVRAANADVYIPSVNSRAVYFYNLDRNGTILSFIPSSATALAVTSNAGKTIAGNYVIREGETQEFNVTVAARLGTLTAGQYRLILNQLRWGLADGPLADIDNQYIFDPNVFRTNHVSLASVQSETQVSNIQEAIKTLLEQLKGKL